MKVDTKLIEEGIDSLENLQLKIELMKLLRSVEKSKAKKSEPKETEGEQCTRYFKMFHELMLSNHYHIRKHQGHHPWRESVRTSNRNLSEVFEACGLKVRGDQ
jgi:hypothetical protein